MLLGLYSLSTFYDHNFYLVLITSKSKITTRLIPSEIFESSNLTLTSSPHGGLPPTEPEIIQWRRLGLAGVLENCTGELPGGKDLGLAESFYNI